MKSRQTDQQIEVYRRQECNPTLFTVLHLNARGLSSCPRQWHFQTSFVVLLLYLNIYTANWALSTKGHLQRSVSMGMVREGGDAPTPSREGNRLSLLLSGYASSFLSYQVKHRFSFSTAFLDLDPRFLWMEPQTLFLFDNVAFFSLLY